MDKFITLYDICYGVLYEVVNNIFALNNNEEKAVLELYNFLTTDGSQFESIFDDITYFKFDEDKTIYKKIMMLIVVSSAYYLSLYQYDHNISQDVNMSIIEDLEELSSKDIIRMFYNLDDNPKIADYMINYCDFVSKNYIFRNGCLETVLKNEKLNELLKINPFELMNFIYYIDLERFLTSEKYIQEFIDLYDSALSFTKDDDTIDEDTDISEVEKNEIFNEHLIQNFKDKVSEYFVYDENKINEFYSYIFSNIYETLIVLINNDKDDSKRRQKLLEIFEECNCQFEELYLLFNTDDDVAFMLIDFFIDTNDDIYEEDLVDRRDDYIKVGNSETLRDLNPYYDEENVVFEQIKQKNKEYPN